MSRTPLVSVVVAAYNCGRFIAEAIESVLAQTVADLDVHVVNDGSTDDTDARVQPFLGNPRIVYHKQANQGQPRAKNCGIRNSRGHYVAFCDADDRWTADKLARQLPLLEAAPDVGLVYTRCAKIDENGQFLSVDAEREFHRGKVTRNLVRLNFVPGATTLIRRSCLDTAGIFDEKIRMGIDWDLWLRLSRICAFDYVDEPKYLYRMWSGQMSNNWRGRYQTNFYILDKFFGEYPHEISAAEQRLVWATQLVERARVRARLSNEHLMGLRDCLMAGIKAPAYTPAWKSMVRIFMWATRLADSAEEDWARPGDAATLARYRASLDLPVADKSS
jgi:glycosyltransferase involved in cell wall biosynthesis